MAQNSFSWKIKNINQQIETIEKSIRRSNKEITELTDRKSLCPLDRIKLLDASIQKLRDKIVRCELEIESLKSVLASLERSRAMQIRITLSKECW